MRLYPFLAPLPLVITLACGSGSGAAGQPTNSVGVDASMPSTAADAGVPLEPDSAAPNRDVAKGVWSLDSEALAANDEDLAPLSRLMQGAEVVGIGETWHTTGGQHSMRARAVRYLVEHEGFRHVMLETPWVSALPLSQYVATGKGLDEGVRSILGAFTSTHMRDLMAWLRAWNVAHPTDLVQFHGFDVQENAEESEALRIYVRGVTTSARADELLSFLPECFCGAFAKTYQCFASPAERDLSNGAGGKFPAARDAACNAGLDRLDAAFQDDKSAWVTASSAQRWKEAAHVAKALRGGQKTEATWDPIEGGYMGRDEAMKSNVLAFGDVYGPAKAVLMAHNGHLERSPNAAFLRAGGAEPSGALMGGRLFAAIGAKYKVIGQAAYEIEINWQGVSKPKPNTRADSIEKALDALARPYLLVDVLNNAVTVPGQVYTIDTQGPFGKFIPEQSFDAILFMHHSAAMISTY